MKESLLSRVRTVAIARYLNTGETLTLTLIVMLRGAETGTTTKQALCAVHTLSASTVSAHLRTLSRKSLITIDGDSIATFV